MRSCCDIAGSGADATNGRGAGSRDLYSFLRDAELDHYYMALTHSLKVTGLAQLKYVVDDDLAQVGMTKPEIRRLRKRFRRECPQSAMERLCRRLAAARGFQQRQSPHRAPTLAIDECDAAAAVAVACTVGGGNGDSDCMIPSQQLQVGRLLGEGDFARVYQAIWRPAGDRGQRLQVAVKVVDKARLLAVAESVGDGVKNFLREAAILMGINHTSVARLFGICAIGEDSLALVTELAPLRSLLECVREPALRATFHPAALCDLAQQVAEGMSHLENRRIVHRDLAARNVLVFSRQRVKISDTGISRALGLGIRHYGANLSPSLKLPAAWCAPECFKRPPEAFTSASDAWSFAVLLWEIFTYGFQPWAGLTGRQILTSLDEPQLCRLGRPDACPAEHYALMLRCWALNPALRPTFAEVAAHLPKIIPERVIARQDSGAGGDSGEFLHFSTGETILVLDKAVKERTPEPDPGGVDSGVSGYERELWRGIRLDGGGSGLFDPNLTRSEQLPSAVMSAGEAGGPSRRARYSQEMISRPHDPQHIGHIGIDGTVFGDIAQQVAKTPGAKVPRDVTEGRAKQAVPEEDEFRLDMGGSLVEEVLLSWSTCSGGGGVKSGDHRRSSECSSLSSDAEASATAAAIATQHRREDSAVVSAASSVSSLMEEQAACSFHRVVDRPRCSSMVLVPPALGALHTPPQKLLAPTCWLAPEQPGQNQQQQVQHLVNHHQHQQQQHATLRSLRTTGAFRAPPGGQPPPKPVRPVVRPEEPGSPWGSAFNINRPTGTTSSAEAVSTGSGSSQRPSIGGDYPSISNAYSSVGGQQPENQEYEEIVNL